MNQQTQWGVNSSRIIAVLAILLLTSLGTTANVEVSTKSKPTILIVLQEKIMGISSAIVNLDNPVIIIGGGKT